MVSGSRTQALKSNLTRYNTEEDEFPAESESLELEGLYRHSEILEMLIPV